MAVMSQPMSAQDTLIKVSLNNKLSVVSTILLFTPPMVTINQIIPSMNKSFMNFKKYFFINGGYL